MLAELSGADAVTERRAVALVSPSALPWEPRLLSCPITVGPVNVTGAGGDPASPRLSTGCRESARNGSEGAGQGAPQARLPRPEPSGPPGRGSQTLLDGHAALEVTSART